MLATWDDVDFPALFPACLGQQPQVMMKKKFKTRLVELLDVALKKSKDKLMENEWKNVINDEM